MRCGVNYQHGSMSEGEFTKSVSNLKIEIEELNVECTNKKYRRSERFLV